MSVQKIPVVLYSVVFILLHPLMHSKFFNLKFITTLLRN